MAAAAKAMARGAHGIRVTATSRDEVGELARAFNAMATDLEDAERQRKELVANVSHELRTPIGALQALLENLADGVEPPDPATLRVALAQTERLGRLVAQLLDLSRLEAGAVPLKPRAFELRPLLEQATRECTLGEERRVRLKVCVQPGDLRVTADPERVHQVVANLLDNAVRHSPAEGRVWLSAYASPPTPRIVLEVSDEGPGIPEEEAQRVFERFHRLDSSRASGTGGSGLGLSIARWIVDAHGGTIRAERREPAGCRMVVELPA
jgi:signal transduction histidine kinase